MNEAREKLGDMIDVLHEPHRGKRQKPRTYRKRTRKDYLSVAKSRKSKDKKIRKAVRRQLAYVARASKIIAQFVRQEDLSRLSKQAYSQLFVISELYRQQQ